MNLNGKSERKFRSETIHVGGLTSTVRTSCPSHPFRDG